MLKSSSLTAAAVSALILVAPGMMQISAAKTSTYLHHVPSERSKAYRAMNVEGSDQGDASAKMWPGIPGRAAAEKMVPWTPTYTEGRGGREY